MPVVPQKLREFIREESLVVFSPGRINLIGEFTDYNKGFVLPAAIDKGVYFVLTLRKDQTIYLFSADFGEAYETSVEELLPSKKSSWPNYILGVVEQFKLAGITIKGFDGAVSGNIPIGAGMSSSAAVECAVAMALNEVAQSGFEKLQLVQMAQKAENNYVGVQCGIMDQFASMFGQPSQAIKIDCRSLGFEYIPLSMDGLRIVLLDSNVKHSHGSSEYNVRRKQCEDGVAMIQQHHPEVQSLRDASLKMADDYILPFDQTIYKRCKFILEENERVMTAAENLKSGDLKSFGEKMFSSHDGLQNGFEASCAEMDFLVNCVKNNDAVVGSRMMGGGFGGCTINLVKEGNVDEIIQMASVAYRKSLNLELTSYVAIIEAGTTILKNANSPF
ncbi:MAG: galactokinase [Chitinophagales bacterium]